MKGILTFLFLTISILSIAQSRSNDISKIDNRLYEVFEKDYLIDLQTKNPSLLQRWAFYLDNAFYITDYPNQKGETDFGSVEITDLKNLNILLLEKKQKLSRDFKKRMKFKIQGTDKILVYYSGEEFNKKLNEHLGRR